MCSDVTGNKLTFLAWDTFTQLTALSTLLISSNAITLWASDVFTNVPSLLAIQCDYSASSCSRNVQMLCHLQLIHSLSATACSSICGPGSWCQGTAPANYFCACQTGFAGTPCART